MAESNVQEGNFVQITGLWENKEKGFLSGKTGGTVWFVFKNDRKQDENSPTHRICVARPIKTDQHENPRHKEKDLAF